MYDHERSLVLEMKGKPFALIGVNSDKDRRKIRATVEEKNLIWRSFWNGPDGPSGPIAEAWGVRSWPSIFLIDAKGVIRHTDVRGSQLDRTIKDLIREIE